MGNSDKYASDRAWNKLIKHLAEEGYVTEEKVNDLFENPDTALQTLRELEENNFVKKTGDVWEQAAFIND